MVLSNCHSPTAEGTVRRRVDGQKTDVVVPQCLADYQKGMKGVDLFDQLVGYYQLQHRSRKWWRRLYFYIQTGAAVNAHIIAKASHPEANKKRWPQLQGFLEDLALDLVGDWRAKRAAPLVEVPVRPIREHTFVQLFQKYKTCRECSLAAGHKQRRGVTKYGCQECNEAVHKDCAQKHIRRHMGQ